MKDYLVCPLWRRPAFLEVWMELITKVKGADELIYIFALDYDYNPLNEEILEKKFPFEYALIKTPATPYKMGKQSYNVLNAMLAASMNTGDDNLIFYLEEDIFPGIDFINWHRRIHTLEPDIFCSVATRNNNTGFKVDDNPDKYYLSSNPDYQSWGSCFRARIINEYIYPHFVEGYFRHPQDYCASHFPGSIIGHYYVEQDGLIRRILEVSGLEIAFPYYPRGYHAGFFGYHRNHHAEVKSHEEQVKFIHDIAFSDERMKNENQYAMYYEDSRPINLAIESDKSIRDYPGI